jgi:hypothetical protein
LPLLEKGLYVVVGLGNPAVVKGDWKGPFPALALICPVRVPDLPVHVLDRIMGEIFALDSPLGRLKKKFYKGYTIRYVVREQDPFHLNDILQPCYTEAEGLLLITNSLSWMESMIDGIDQLIKTVKGPLIAEATLRFKGLYKSIVGLGSPLSDILIDTEENRRRVRQEVEALLRRQGRSLQPEQVDRLVQEHLNRDRLKFQQQILCALRITNYLDRFTLQASCPNGSNIEVEMELFVLEE